MKNKFNILFIRACKSSKPKVRVKTLYKRSISNNEYKDFDITKNLIIILSHICEKYKVKVIQDLIYGLSPLRYRYINLNDESYYNYILEILITAIRTTFNEKFPKSIQKYLK